jgi:hypothetical protein
MPSLPVDTMRGGDVTDPGPHWYDDWELTAGGPTPEDLRYIEVKLPHDNPSVHRFHCGTHSQTEALGKLLDKALSTLTGTPIDQGDGEPKLLA